MEEHCVESRPSTGLVQESQDVRGFGEWHLDPPLRNPCFRPDVTRSPRGPFVPQRALPGMHDPGTAPTIRAWWLSVAGALSGGEQCGLSWCLDPGLSVTLGLLSVGTLKGSASC